MNLLLTMDTGGVIPPNVKASHEAAMNRWGGGAYANCGSPTKRVFVDKCYALAREGTSNLHRRVCWIDGDLILRADAPSPFDLTAPGSVGGVRNQVDADGEAMQARFWHELGGDGVGPIDHATYINGGLIVMEPAIHSKVWRAMLANVTPQYGDMNPLVEQTLLNIMLRAFEVPVTILPDAMNLTGDVPWISKGPMKAWGYHLACCNGHREGKRERLASIDWLALPNGAA